VLVSSDFGAGIEPALARAKYGLWAMTDQAAPGQPDLADPRRSRGPVSMIGKLACKIG
jgi:hypothetical protein